ncbi:choice-of-anchor D domain-containing protein [Flavobacterium suaedae]|uniref:choice-of-anchor D domain-containing protein n=1 Tax=Flavobacterium suaedae TaxID=1767027 RepID=UPI00166C6F16|nr:choice-of-anchor D domain-containing protein [Flavobacterium suaedae]
MLALAVVGITGLSFGNFKTISGLLATESTSMVACSGGGNETFSNLGSSQSNYTTRTWTGNDGISWEATDARTDQDLDGDAIAVRSGHLINTSTISGGVGTVSFDYARVFSGNSTLKLYVNGTQYGSDITVSSTSSTTFTQAVNVAGDATIELVNSGKRTIIDNLTWDCYPSISGPELQVADSGNNNFDCDSLTVNFGSQAVNDYNDQVFYIKNLGTTDLDVSSLTLSNTTDFSIISPSGAFTVAPSNSSIILVRFQSATAGAKTSTLTIASNDADEASCVVNLSGVALGACVAPADADELVISNVTSSSADVEVENNTADGYIAILSDTTPLSAAPSDATEYQVNDAIGNGTVAYVGASSTFTISDLEEDSDYYLFIYAYNSVDCTGGPLYSSVAGEDEIQTPVAPCIGGSESFSNMGSSQSNYATRTWTGDNGVEWEATDARTDQSLTDEAIAIRTGYLTNTTTVSGGIGTLSFDYARVFSGESTLKVFVNGNQVGTDVTVSETTATEYSVAVDVDGDVTIRIENSGNRTIIDNLAWDCYSTPTTQELQLLDSNLANQDCGYNLEFGNVETSVDTERTFTIQNRGALDLNVSSLVLSDATNYSIVSPTTVPFVIAPQGTQDVTVRFNSATAAAYPATLTINNNDADESACVVKLNANAQDACAAPGVTGEVAISNITSTSADFAVSNVTANGYVAVVVSASGTVEEPVNGTSYEVNDMLGDGVVAYVGTDANFTISDLDPETYYLVFIHPYNDADCFGAPVYALAGIEDEVTTAAAPCVGGSENFDNLGSSSSSYSTRTWTGNNGVIWQATDARTDQDLNDDAIAIRTGSLTNTTAVSGGIGTLSFNYARVFSGESTLKVFVNGTQYGSDITVSETSATLFSQSINVSGDVTIEIENSGNRTIIDDVSWDCYSAPATQELQLLDSSLNNQECGFAINYGDVQTGVNADQTFTIENIGLQALSVSDLVLSDATNYSIVTPATSSFTVAAQSTQTVTVRFNSASEGTFPATLTISSDDANEGTCVVNFSATAQDVCAAPANTGEVAISNVTTSSADIAVSSVTADGYIALVLTSGTVGTLNDGTVYAVGSSVGDAVVAYVGPSASFTASDLADGTYYQLYVYPYNSANCFGGPVYATAAIEDEITTPAAPCSGVAEAFDNLGSSSSSYSTRTWTGNGGIDWTATDARTDQDLNGDAIAIRTGSLTNDDPISGGIGTLTFNYARVFSGNSTIKVYVNGVQVGSDVTVSSTSATQFSEVVNVAGNVSIEIENSGNRTIIDDVTWDCYSAPSSRIAVEQTEAKEVSAPSTVASNEVVLYPNPNNGEFFIELPSVDANAEVTVFDSLGKQIISKKVTGKESINMENANQGIYMVVITSGNNVTTKKVVIK